MGRKFPAGDLRRTQPITSKAEVRGGEGRGGWGGEEGSREEAEGARQTREKSMRRRKQRSGREWTITAVGAPLFSPLIGRDVRCE